MNPNYTMRRFNNKYDLHRLKITYVIAINRCLLLEYKILLSAQLLISSTGERLRKVSVYAQGCRNVTIYID